MGDRIEAVMGWSASRYQKEIVDAYNRMFSGEIDYFGTKLKGYWMESNLGIVGDTFLSFSPPVNKDGIVAPALKRRESEDGKTQG